MHFIFSDPLKTYSLFNARGNHMKFNLIIVRKKSTNRKQCYDLL
jgi:hypothetical protein